MMILEYMLAAASCCPCRPDPAERERERERERDAQPGQAGGHSKTRHGGPAKLQFSTDEQNLTLFCQILSDFRNSKSYFALNFTGNIKL